MSLYIPVNNRIALRGCLFLTVIAASRLLRPLERQLVMNLLWLEAAVPASTMAAWVTREGKR